MKNSQTTARTAATNKRMIDFVEGNLELATQNLNKAHHNLVRVLKDIVTYDACKKENPGLIEELLQAKKYRIEMVAHYQGKKEGYTEVLQQLRYDMNSPVTENEIK